MKVLYVIPKTEFKCECGCKDYSVIDTKEKIVVCKHCGKQIDTSKFNFEWKE